MRNPLIYDGFDLGLLLHIESKPRRPLMAETEITANDYVGRDGSVFAGSRLMGRTIEIDVRLFAKQKSRRKRHLSLEDLRRQLSYRLYRDKPCKLVLPTSPDIYDMAILDGSTDLTNISYTDTTTLIFRCPEPASYGQDYNEAKEAGAADFLVGGSYKTVPTITVSPVNAPFVLTVDGKPLHIVGSPDGTCIIGNHKVLNADGAAIRYALTDDLPVWEPGYHHIESPLPYKIEWTERWL